jgi:hypothetical protein
LLTAYSNDRTKYRWCMVTAITDFSVRVVPRSSSGGEGVFVPREALEAFTEDGHFWRNVKSVHVRDLRGYQYGGQLGQPYRSDVCDMADRRPGR